MRSEEYYKPLTDFVGKEIIILNKRYRILGIFDDDVTLSFVCYDGDEEYIMVNSFFYIGVFSDENKLANTALPEKCIDLMREHDPDIYAYIKDGVIYSMDMYPNPEPIGYIHYNNKEIRLDYDILTTYNCKTNEFEYVEPMFNLKLTDKSYVKLIVKIKKAYYDLTMKYLDNKMTKKQAKAFNEMYLYSTELNKDL